MLTLTTLLQIDFTQCQFNKWSSKKTSIASDNVHSMSGNLRLKRNLCCIQVSTCCPGGTRFGGKRSLDENDASIKSDDIDAWLMRKLTDKKDLMSRSYLSKLNNQKASKGVFNGDLSVLKYNPNRKTINGKYTNDGSLNDVKLNDLSAWVERQLADLLNADSTEPATYKSFKNSRSWSKLVMDSKEHRKFQGDKFVDFSDEFIQRKAEEFLKKCLEKNTVKRRNDKLKKEIIMLAQKLIQKLRYS